MGEQELRAKLDALHESVNEIKVALTGDESRGIPGLVKRVAKLEKAGVAIFVLLVVGVGLNFQEVVNLLRLLL